MVVSNSGRADPRKHATFWCKTAEQEAAMTHRVAHIVVNDSDKCTDVTLSRNVFPD